MFCPFVHAECRSDCVFRCNKTAVASSLKANITECLIVKKLDAINEYQSDQLSEIANELRRLE